MSLRVCEIQCIPRNDSRSIHADIDILHILLHARRAAERNSGARGKKFFPGPYDVIIEKFNEQILFTISM